MIDRSLEDETELVVAVATAAGMHLENAWMQVELRARLTELGESRRRLLEAARTERVRLERELHDGAEQRLMALRLEFEVLDQQLTEPDLKRKLAHAASQVSASLSPVRAELSIEVTEPVSEPVAVARLLHGE